MADILQFNTLVDDAVATDIVVNVGIVAIARAVVTAEIIGASGIRGSKQRSYRLP